MATIQDGQSLPHALERGLRRTVEVYRLIEAFWHDNLFARRIAIAVLVALYLCLWAVSGAFKLNVTDFDVFFLPSARVALDGHPWLIYTVRYQGIYPNANGPLSILPLTAVAAVAQHLGWLDNPQLRRMLAMAAFSSFMLLMGREVVLIAERLRGIPFRELWRLLAYALIVLSPQLWHSVLLYGHIEQPMMLWLVLMGTRALMDERPKRAGILFGLALLTRSVTLLYLLPLTLLLLRRHRWRACLWLVGEAAVVLALGLLPFWLADRNDLLYSLLTFRGLLPVSGGSITGLAQGTPLQAFAQAHDSAVVVGAVLLLSIVTLALRRDLDVASRDTYALLGLASLCFPLFMKTLWPYYFLDPYVFLALWWLAGVQPLRRPVAWALWWLGLLLPCGVIACAQIGESGVVASQQGTWPLIWTLLACAAMLTLALAVALWVWIGQRYWRHLVETLEHVAGPRWLRDAWQELRGIIAVET